MAGTRFRVPGYSALIHRLRSSFWPLPIFFGLAALAAASALLWVDSVWTSEALAEVGPPFSMSVDTARQLLATLAGAVITVLGLMFSLTLVSMTLAAGNLGVRLLDRYRQNHVVQVTMGGLIGTFVFICVVLSGLDVAGDSVPRLSVATALTIATLSVVWLGFAFHDLSRRLQIDEETDEIGSVLNAQLAAARQTGAGWRVDPGPPSEPPPDGLEILAERAGYVQAIDFTTLAAALARAGRDRPDAPLGLTVLLARAGDHLVPTDPLALISGDIRHAEAIRRAVRTAVTVGIRRTSADDPLFNFHLLVEVAARALSPGINDHYTALNAIDQIIAGIAAADAAGLARYRFEDAEGNVILRTRMPDRVDVVQIVFGALRQNVVDHPKVVIHTLDGLRRLARLRRDDRLSQALIAEVEDLADSGMRRAHDPPDRAAIERMAGQAVGALQSR